MNKLALWSALFFTLMHPCAGQPPATTADVVGVWEGTLHTFGQESRLIYKIWIRNDGALAASHDIPDYSLNDIEVSEVKLNGDRLTIKISLYEGLFAGTVGREVIRGIYTTALLQTPLTLWRRSKNPRFLLDTMVPRLERAGKPMRGYHYRTPAAGDDGWAPAHAAAAGLDTSKIGTLMRRILAGDFPNLHSIVVVKDGKLIVDEYFHGFHRDKPHRISSVGKTVTAALIGIMLQKGAIRDIHTPLCELFPEYSDLLCAGEKRQLTLYHLLTMTTGLQWNEHALTYFDTQNDLNLFKSSPDPLRNLFERPLVYRPGEHFFYNTGCIIALETLIQNITKAHFLLFAQKELFTPMMISNLRWDFSEGLYLLPRDMAKLGWLFLQRGDYQGSRILAEAWADSALGRFERDRPCYFNHWWPMVFFAEDVPVKALQSGGWGGQSITILPTLNAVIVMTGANQLVPANYDLCISDYLLPAIMTPVFMASHPTAAYSGIHRTKNLKWEMRWDTEMGCLKAAVASLGLHLGDAQLYGGTGVGFLINIDARAEAKSMAVWNWHGVYALCNNLGFAVESIWSHKSNPDFQSKQKEVWDRVRGAIDSGQVCYGFHLDNPIRTLTLGCDKIGYYYMGWEAEKGKGPVYWYQLGDTDIGLLGMHFVQPVPATNPYREMVKQALQFVLEFSAGAGKWVPADCKAGLEGYARWIALIEAGKEDGDGLSYNAAELAEARRFAVAFLEEAKSRCGTEFALLFDTALGPYRRSASALEELTRIFPHNVPAAQREANLRDQTRRQSAIRSLQTAREAEAEGLKVLQNIADRL